MTHEQTESKDAGKGGSVVAQGEEDVTISDNGDASRYEVHVGGELAGFSEYERRGDSVVFTHTEIDPAFEGRGIGSRLAKYALDDAHTRHLHVVPTCPFIADYIRRHPEYANRVPR